MTRTHINQQKAGIRFRHPLCVTLYWLICSIKTQIKVDAFTPSLITEFLSKAQINK